MYTLPNSGLMINLGTNKIFLLSVQEVGSGYSSADLCFFSSDSYYLTGVISVKDPGTYSTILQLLQKLITIFIAV